MVWVVGRPAVAADDDLRRASELIARGALEEACGVLSEVVAREPANGSAFFLLGVAHARGERFKDAETYLRKARELSPSAGNVRYALGSVLWNLDRLDEAAVEEEAASRAIPTSPEPEYVLGSIAAQRREWPRARERLGEALRRDENHVPSLYRRSLVGIATGDDAAAEKDLRACLARDAGHLGGRYALAQLLLRTGRREDGTRELVAFEEAARRTKLESRESRRREKAGFCLRDAAVLLDEGKAAEAIPLALRALEFDPGRVEARSLLARAYRALGREADAAREEGALRALDGGGGK